MEKYKKTTFCILCMENFTQDIKPSPEHIIPESLGGSIQYYCLCKSCNSKVGSLIDSKLSDNMLVRGTSQILGIKNKKNKIPNIFQKSKHCYFNNQDIECDILFDKNNRTYSKIKERVNVSIIGNKIKIAGCCSTKNIDSIIEKIEKSSKKKNILDRINFDNLRHKLINESEPIKYPSKVVLKFQYNTEDFIKPIIKIAFEMAYYWLGENYKNDPVGIIIHDWLYLFDNYNLSDLKTNVSIKYKDEFENYFFNLDPHNHIIFFKEIDESLICFVQIYNLFQTKILISKNSKKYCIPYGNGNMVDSPLIINNSIKKQFKEYGFWDYIMRNGVELYDKKYNTCSAGYNGAIDG